MTPGKGFFTEIGWLILTLGIALFASAFSGWLAAYISSILDHNNFFHLLLGLLTLPLMLFSLLSLIFQGIVAAFLNDAVTLKAITPGNWGDYKPFFVSMSYIWWQPLLGLGILLATGGIKTPKVPAFVVPILAALSPSHRAERRQADQAKMNAKRSNLSAELDEILSETERVKEEIRARQHGSSK